MSNREMIVSLSGRIPDSELVPVVGILQTLCRLTCKDDYVEEVEPDAWDLRMIEEAEKENTGNGISLEFMAKDLGLNV